MKGKDGMHKGLFGRQAVAKKEIRLKLFCDESGSREWLCTQAY